HIPKGPLPCLDALKTQFFKNPNRSNVYFIDASYDRREAMLFSGLHYTGAGHLCRVSLSGKVLKHRVHQLRFGMHSGDLNKPAKASEVLCALLVDQPGPNASQPE